MKKSKLKVISHVFLVSLLALFLLTSSAMAASKFEVSTAYPGITAGSGETITFPLEIKNDDTQSWIAEIKVDELPEGWQASFEGRGREISEIFVHPASVENASLKVQIPQNAEENLYTVAVSARSDGSLLDRLNLHVNVTEQPVGQDQLKAQYSELKGSADASFSYKLSLTNNSNEEQVYSLGADLPQGWQVTFKPSYEQQEVASITVAAGQTIDLNVSIKPAPGTEMGEYTVPVYAVTGSGQVSEEVTLIVGGSYRMSFSTASGRLNADVVAGQEKKITMQVENSGSAPLTNINLSAQTPNNWNVSYDTENIDILKPGEIRQVTATLTADSKAIAGDYGVTLTAYASEIRKTADIRVTVKTSTLWGFVGIFIVILVCGGVYWVFRKYGRR